MFHLSMLSLRIQNSFSKYEFLLHIEVSRASWIVGCFSIEVKTLLYSFTFSAFISMSQTPNMA